MGQPNPAQGANATVIPPETVFQVHHATCSRREEKKVLGNGGKSKKQQQDKPQKNLPLVAEHHGHVLKHNKNDFLMMFTPFYLIGKGIWHGNG
jgi:hypothetical protein